MHNDVERGRLFDQILEISFEEIYIFDAISFNFVNASRGTLKNIGYTMAELEQLTPCDIKLEFTKEAFFALVQPLISGETEIEAFETVHTRKDGSKYNVSVRLQFVTGDHPVFIAMVTDITERMQYENELKDLAFRDPGTHLYNKRFFREQLKLAANSSNRQKSPVGLILIDMDDFSIVNNEYGHLAGDEVITAIASKIEKVFPRKTDIVARFGGDEFVVMCNGAELDTLKIKCLELINDLRNTIKYNDNDILQTASIGVSWHDGKHTLVPSKLLDDADTAMYEAKKAGKDTFKVHQQEKYDKHRVHLRK